MEVVTGGQHKLYHQFGSGAAAPLVGRGGQSVQVDYGLGERAQDFESDGPGCKSQLCPAWTGLLISLGGVQICECCAGAEMGTVLDVVPSAPLVESLLPIRVPFVASRNAERIC